MMGMILQLIHTTADNVKDNRDVSYFVCHQDDTALLGEVTPNVCVVFIYTIFHVVINIEVSQ